MYIGIVISSPFISFISSSMFMKPARISISMSWISSFEKGPYLYFMKLYLWSFIIFSSLSKRNTSFCSFVFPFILFTMYSIRRGHFIRLSGSSFVNVLLKRRSFSATSFPLSVSSSVLRKGNCLDAFSLIKPSLTNSLILCSIVVALPPTFLISGLMFNGSS